MEVLSGYRDVPPVRLSIELLVGDDTGFKLSYSVLYSRIPFKAEVLQYADLYLNRTQHTLHTLHSPSNRRSICLVIH